LTGSAGKHDDDASQNENQTRIMKASNPALMLGLAVALLLVATGCQSVSTTAIQDIGTPQYAAVDPTHVQILRTEPTRPNVRIGQVRAVTSSPDVAVPKIEEALRKKAAKLGADALVIVYDNTQITGAQVMGGWFNRSVMTTEGRVIIGVAIKYK
jgi:hypothetical protein